MKAPKSV